MITESVITGSVIAKSEVVSVPLRKKKVAIETLADLPEDVMLEVVYAFGLQQATVAKDTDGILILDCQRIKRRPELAPKSKALYPSSPVSLQTRFAEDRLRVLPANFRAPVAF